MTFELSRLETVLPEYLWNVDRTSKYLHTAIGIAPSIDCL